MGRMKRETVIGAETSGVSGTRVVATISNIEGLALDGFEELVPYLEVTTSLAGTSPTMDVRLQRAIVPDADPTNDDHWDSFLAFNQVTDTSGHAADGKSWEMAKLPVVPVSTSAIQTAAATARDYTQLTANRAKMGHWGDRIRVIETMGGVVTTPAVYNLHFNGRLPYPG